MFEPFHSNYVDICKEFIFRQYLRSDNSEVKYLEPARQIISGRIRDDWIDRFNKKLICKDRLIKDIRANLLLKWLKTQFPEMKIVFLLRHPLAVVNSRIKLGWGSNTKLFLSQDDLIADYLEPYVKEINGAKSGFEKQIFSWCIENHVPLKQLSKKDVHVVFYEDFILKAEETIKTLFEYLGIDFKNKIMKKLHIPSPQVREESAILTGENLIDKWKKNYDKGQIKRAIEILSIFDLDEVYSSNSLPISSKVSKMMK